MVCKLLPDVITKGIRGSDIDGSRHGISSNGNREQAFAQSLRELIKHIHGWHDVMQGWGVGTTAFAVDGLEADATVAKRANERNGMLDMHRERGMSLYREGRPPLHIPSQAREVFDVTGAGDTVIATLSLSLAAGASLDAAARIANAAAGVVVAKLGTATVSPAELKEALRP